MGFKTAFNYAWHGSGRRWDAAPIGIIGGLIGGFVFWFLGLKLPQTIIDNPLWDAVAAIVLGAFTGAVVAFIARLCWWPFHYRLEPHGGLQAFLRAQLGDLMWPTILIASGISAFVLLTGGGVVWLSLRVLKAAPAERIETPNTVGSPDFALFPPRERYRFTWPGSNLMQFYLRLDSEKNPIIGNNPAFILRNRTNTVAYRVAATWKSETSMNIHEITLSSPKLELAKFIISDTAITIIPKNNMQLIRVLKRIGPG